MTRTVTEQKAGSRRVTRPVASKVMLTLVVAALFVGVLVVRGWRPTSSTSDTSQAMPTSAQIEFAYGIRFTGVGVTAGGGMIQIRYQVLDSDKSSVVHAADTAPFVIDAKGVKYADPGMVGHSHIGKDKTAGSSDYILLANSKGGVTPGSTVTIKVGTLSLSDVPVG